MSVKGTRVELSDAPAAREALDAAFDYRGDVTLVLRDGASLTGYLFSHEPDADPPHVRILPASPDAARVSVPIASIASLEFSGDDKASGRSWEAWVRRHEERLRRRAEGADLDDVEPQPEALG